MSRCKCCDAIIKGNPGFLTLEDGTRIEEDFCKTCRNISRNPPEERSFAFEDITEYSFIYSPNGLKLPLKTGDD